MTKSVRRYVTRDDLEFKTKAEADQHERYLTYVEWYEEQGFKGPSFCISWEDWLGWMKEHKEMIMKIMEECV